MSKKILQSRYYQLISIIAILMLALSIRLFVLTVLQEDKWAEAAVNQNTKEVVTSAPRGEILDRKPMLTWHVFQRSPPTSRFSPFPLT